MLEGTIDGGAVGLRIELESVDDVDALDDEDAVLVLDLAPRLGVEPALAGRDVTRLQRASKRPGQSAGGGGDDVVERGRALGFAAARDPVVVSDFVVDAEPDRLRRAGQLRPAQRSLQPFDLDTTGVDDLAHG